MNADAAPAPKRNPPPPPPPKPPGPEPEPEPVPVPGTVVDVDPNCLVMIPSMHVRSADCWAAVSVGGFTVAEIVSPPVLTEAVSLGTVPDSCSASSDSAPTAPVTPFTLATSATACAGKVISVPGTKKSCVNLVPAGPSLARSVMTDEFAAASAAASVALSPAPPRPKKPPPPPPANPPPPVKPPPPPKPPVGVVVVVVAVDSVGATVRVTMMSVPTDLRGDSALVWASLRPCDTPMMPMTSPTPAARPAAVTSVRPMRRRSSFHI